VELFTSRAFGHRALGWDTAEGDYGSGRFLGPSAYGHTGFTGTSMWIDPEREMFVILLTNRVHAARALRPAKVISDVRADLSDAAVLSILDGPKVASGSRRFRADREVGWNPPPRRVSRRRHGSSRHHTIASATARSRASSAKKSSGRKAIAKKSTKTKP